MLKRAVGSILAEAALPESADSARCHRRLAVSKKTVVTLQKGRFHEDVTEKRYELGNSKSHRSMSIDADFLTTPDKADI